MRGFTGLLRAEARKFAHTPVLWAHILLPLAGAFIFLIYDAYSAWSPQGETQMYLEALSVVWPFVAGIICGYGAEMEIQNGGQNLLALPYGRTAALLAKWTVLMGMGLFASMLAVVGFGLVYRTFPGGDIYPPGWYFLMAVVIWAGQGVVYAFHLFLALCFGSTVSISVGVVGAVLSALMLTGLGNGRWMFFPHAWSGRWCDFMLALAGSRGDSALEAALAGQWKAPLIVCLAIFIILGAAVLIWFKLFEGRKEEA